jgi:hypothetical protein
MRSQLESNDDVRALAELVEELHAASSEAATEGFTHMARQLDECGFAFADKLVEARSDERVLVEQARRCLEMWRALRSW